MSTYDCFAMKASGSTARRALCLLVVLCIAASCGSTKVLLPDISTYVLGAERIDGIVGDLDGEFARRGYTLIAGEDEGGVLTRFWLVTDSAIKAARQPSPVDEDMLAPIDEWILTGWSGEQKRLVGYRLEFMGDDQYLLSLVWGPVREVDLEEVNLRSQLANRPIKR